MTDIAGFPYFESEVDKTGALVDPAKAKQVIDFVAGGGATDLIVMSHGWNNDMADARDLYRRFFAEVRKRVDAATPAAVAGRSFAVLGVLWPSKKFADASVIPGGAASLSQAVGDATLEHAIDALGKGTFDNPKADAILKQAKALVPLLKDSPAKQAEFADLVRSLPFVSAASTRKTGAHASAADAEDAADRFFALSGADAMARLAKPVLPVPAKRSSGGAASIGAGMTGIGAGTAGGASGIGSFFSGVGSAALNLLNYTTYYQMKERAGLIGSGVMNDLLREVAAKAPKLRLHLVGHSFGARLVTSIALGPAGKPPLAFASMTLLQAAFSHNGFAQKFDGQHDGFFRDVVAQHRVRGPILASFSVHDQAVGRAYPIASLAAGQNASALGDANDPYGGMGRNGAQHTPEASQSVLGPVGTAYALQPGQVRNLDGDALIADHSDICKPELAYATLCAAVS